MSSVKTVGFEAIEYIKRNKLKTAIVILTMILAYGFYVSSYTINIDDVFTDFWNGGRLVAAGRFTGYFVQLVTGIMTYSPFFTMFLGLVIFFAAGLIFAIVLSLMSGKKISDSAIFVFWIVFVTYPIISEQMVFPIIVLLALGYLMTALSLYLVNVFFENKSKSSLVISMVMMILYIDFYEAFASVYLTLMMCVIFVKFIYSSNPDDKKIGKIIVTMIKFVVILAVAIAIRMVISKIVLYAFYGTTKTGYSGNNSIYWLNNGIIDCAIWLIRTVFFKYFWAAVDYLPIFIFVVCVIAGTIASIIISAKKKSAIPVLAFLFMIAGTLSLNVLIGLATGYTMAQSLAVFVAFTVTMFFIATDGKKFWKSVISICICLLVLNQAKSLNAWSVVNYERCNYEVKVVDTIGQDLITNYSVREKPVIFISGDRAPVLPDYFKNRCESELPAVKKAQKVFLKVSEKILPERFIRNICGLYGADENSVQGLYNLVKCSRNVSSSSTSYIAWCVGGKSWFSQYDDTVGYGDAAYALFASRGYDLIHCTKDEYNAVCDDYEKYPAYPYDGYIIEKQNCIIVNFGK